MGLFLEKGGRGKERTKNMSIMFKATSVIDKKYVIAYVIALKTPFLWEPHLAFSI